MITYFTAGILRFKVGCQAWLPEIRALCMGSRRVQGRLASVKAEFDGYLPRAEPEIQSPSMQFGRELDCARATC